MYIEDFYGSVDLLKTHDYISNNIIYYVNFENKDDIEIFMKVFAYLGIITTFYSSYNKGFKFTLSNKVNEFDSVVKLLGAKIKSF